MSRNVRGKWRNAISITEDAETGEIKMWRYSKQDARWIQITYFSTEEDFDEFIDFLDDMCEGGEEDDEDEETDQAA